MKRLLSGLLSLVLARGVLAAPLRLCLPDMSIPPYVSADPTKPGLLEKLLLDSARAAGLEVSVQRMPPLRCRRAMQDGSADVSPMVASSSISNCSRPWGSAPTMAR